MRPMDGWSIEDLHGDVAQALRMDRVLYDSGSAHQRIRVFENATFGRVMTLDNVVQLTERDNFVYHKVLSHLPMISAGAFADPRLDVVIADGAAFVAGTTGRFDVVIVDSTDPVGLGEVLSLGRRHSGYPERHAVPPGIALSTTMQAFRAASRVRPQSMRLRKNSDSTV